MLKSCHAVGDVDGGQASAVPEGLQADSRHAVGDVDGGQAIAVQEGPVADSRHTVGDVDGGQASAVPEGIVADSRHAVADSAVIDRGGGWRCRLCTFFGSPLLVASLHRDCSGCR